MASTMAELKPLYKKLLRMAKTLPDAAKRESTVQQIRKEFRSHGDLSDPKAVAELVQRAQSKISYLKIVTPRASSDAGVKSFVYVNGKRVEGSAQLKEEGARFHNADYNAQMQRHTQLLRRQHFMDRK